MAEKIISPGVFTKEIDQSFLPAAVGEIGAAVVGPTVKGPALVPTVVSSMAEYEALFGTTFKSGSGTYQYFTSHIAESYLKNTNKLTVVRILDGSPAVATSLVPTGSGNYHTGSSGVADNPGIGAFKLNTRAEGSIMNNSSSLGGTNNTLSSGSSDNVRWEVSSVNPDKGTFTLLLRAGNDTEKRKQILETWNNLSLDPNSNNYISKVVGDQYVTAPTDQNDAYLKYNGQYPNKSKYVYVSNVFDTVDYLDENGNIRLNASSASLPGEGSGSFDGAFNGGSDGYTGYDSLGNPQGSSKTRRTLFYENIASTDSQGYVLSATTAADGGDAYMKALALLNNSDEYDINLLFLPGIVDSFGGAHTGIITKAVDVCEERGDCFFVYDPVGYDTTNVVTVTTQVETRDSNYAAAYWPWVQISDSKTGKLRWVPPSVELAGIFSFNDKVAHPWFAPAGLNRGGLDTVVQAARKLTQKNRDDLYQSNVNPIATFPGQGVVVFGQKTLQKKSSALDRINVRRLLIKVKKFIASSSRFLVFEQNTAATRQRFLNIANPFLEQVQSQSGLSAFKVVMDESNNTPDVVDRNILYGQLFLQPTRTAEFIVLDFTIQSTGASFPE